MIKEFTSDEEYLRWCNSHRDWYVLNGNRSLSPISLVIHRAHCRSITEPKGYAKPGGFVEGKYLKIASQNVDELQSWVRQERLTRTGQFDGIARECQKCMQDRQIPDVHS